LKARSNLQKRHRGDPLQIDDHLETEPISIVIDGNLPNRSV
jgi:hypothetical protein